jgi:hypothetical protein
MATMAITIDLPKTQYKVNRSWSERFPLLAAMGRLLVIVLVLLTSVTKTKTQQMVYTAVIVATVAGLLTSEIDFIELAFELLLLPLKVRAL